MSNLNQARQMYPTGTKFISATGRTPILEVSELAYAKHEDRQEEIKSIEDTVLEIYREMYPKKPKDFFYKLKPFFISKPEFAKAVEDLMERKTYLENLEKDIINLEPGGVIYCSETKKWAEVK